MRSFGLTLGLVAAAVPGFAQRDGLSEKGVILSEKPNSAQYRILLLRDGKMGEINSSYEFHTGDKFQIILNLNRGANYLYVLNRTLTGSPDNVRQADRGVILASDGQPTSVSASEEAKMLDQNGVKTTRYSLVFESKRPVSGESVVPSNNRFQMDAHPGMEEMLVVVSKTPQTLRQLLSAASNSDAQKLRRELAEMAANSEVAEPPMPEKGFAFVDAPKPDQPSHPSPNTNQGTDKPNPQQGDAKRTSCGAVAPRNQEKPYLLQLNLSHR